MDTTKDTVQFMTCGTVQQESAVISLLLDSEECENLTPATRESMKLLGSKLEAVGKAVQNRAASARGTASGKHIFSSGRCQAEVG